MRAKACAVWFGLGVFVGTTAHAAEPTSATESGPDIELLEYLGGLVQERDEKWVGPDDMQAPTEDHDATIEFDDDTNDVGKVK